MAARAALVATFVLLFAGCVQVEPLNTGEGGDPATAALTPVRDRADLPFRADGKYSFTLEEGPFGILPGKGVLVDVEIPLGEGMPTQKAHMGLFLPEIEGCDWDAQALPDECRVPVIADVGPYYGEIIGDKPATEPANRLGGFLIENFVPHGYAVAQVSVLGTGDSGGCMDLMGEVEQAGIQAAVEWLGTQAWSNGNVGLIGRSYDGSTPWEAAMVPSPHLKTIVPISGLQGVHELMWRNGSAEFRAPAVLWGLYYAFTYTNNGGSPTLQAQQIAENAVCPDTKTGGAQALAAYLTGDRVVPEFNDYWVERSFTEKALANYNGSIYYIHGLEDWNVDTHMAFPYYRMFQDAGFEMKGLFGQWAHNYPDRLEEHESCDGSPELCTPPTSVRYDWAQDLLEWFDHYLKGTGPKPELHVEVQDDQGAWRIEETYPPRDHAWKPLALGDDLKFQGSGAPVIKPTELTFVGNENLQLKFVTEPLAEGLRIAGLPQLHVTVTPMGSGGQIYAELRDADDGGRHLGHAVMDLRFADGGRDAKPVVPGQPIVAKMEFFAMDTYVPAGHRLELVLASTGWDYLPASTSAPVEVKLGEDSVLRLPVVERAADAFFAPPGVDAVLPQA